MFDLFDPNKMLNLFYDPRIELTPNQSTQKKVYYESYDARVHKKLGEFN